jgi:voltage-gated potassium channel
MKARDGEALERFERATALPMLVLALAIIPLLVIPLTVDLSPAMTNTLEVIGWMIWAVFAAEYGIRLYLAPDKGHFVRHNIVDLLVVILPFLRPLRVMRSARALRLLRAIRAVVILARVAEAARNVLRRHGLQYVLLVAMGVVVAGGLLIEEAERNAPGAHIHNVADGLWWAVTTVTTVGYGDTFPVTPAGKGIAVVLMLLGIGLFGALAASLSAFFIERHQDDTFQPQIHEVMERLQRIEDALGVLATHWELAAAHGGDGSGGVPRTTE